MRKKGKSPVIALCFALAITGIAGCAGSGQKNESKSKEDTGKKTKEISAWLPAKAPEGNDKELWTEIVKPFEEEHNVNVNFEFIPWNDYEAKYASAIQMGNGPDVGYLYLEMFPDYIDSGLVEDLEPYLTEEDYENYIYMEKGKVWDKVYGLVLDIGNPVAVYYNKDILDSLGEQAPETWEDLERIAKAATQDTDGDGKIDQWGLAQGWGQTFSQDLVWNWYSFLFQAGGDNFDADGKVILDQDAAVETAAFLNNLKNVDNVIPEDCMSQTNGEMFANYFLTGKAAFSVNGINLNNAKMLEEKEAPFEYDFTMTLKNEEMGARCGLDQLVLMSGAEDKELSVELMKYMTGPEGGEAWHKATQGAPVHRGEEVYTFPMMVKALEEGADVLRPLTPALRAPQVYENLWKSLQNMMNGSITPEQAMKEVTEFGNNLDYQRQSK